MMRPGMAAFQKHRDSRPKLLAELQFVCSPHEAPSSPCKTLPGRRDRGAAPSLFLRTSTNNSVKPRAKNRSSAEPAGARRFDFVGPGPQRGAQGLVFG